MQLINFYKYIMNSSIYFLLIPNVLRFNEYSQKNTNIQTLKKRPQEKCRNN